MRKLVKCVRCFKTKEHFGRQMCSPCLRKTKRETQPHFYLQTCYSELSRRVKTYDPLRPNYYGLDKCTKRQFLDKFLNNREFLLLYYNWQHRGFQRKFAPSIDRIDNTLGYTLDNIRFIQQSKNSVKDVVKAVRLFNGHEFLEFVSQRNMADYFNVSPATICKALKRGNYKGVKIERV